MGDVLRIWDEYVRFIGFRPGELVEIEESFGGSVRPATAEGIPPAITVRLLRADVTTPTSGSVAVRHRGGSSAPKFFTDGTPFDGAGQARDVVVLSEGDGIASYYADGALVVAASREVVIYTHELPELLLSDVVENWLLSRARGRGEVQMHCAGWLRNGRVELVVGDSGVGKTTALFAAIREGAGFFSNDRAFVRLRGVEVEARSFPLPVNVGCGTIRALGLDIPHFDLPDDSKIRLIPREVAQRFRVDFERWSPVRAVQCVALADLARNTFWEGDPDHPFWNAVARPGGPLFQRPQLEEALIRLASQTPRASSLPNLAL